MTILSCDAVAHLSSQTCDQLLVVIVYCCCSTLCLKKNRTRILWSITYTNIGQYQCHLTELSVQQYLIIYHKNYSHRRVSAATVTMATSALVQTNVCAITSRLPIVHVPPSSICARPHLISFLPTSGHLILRPKSGQLQNWGLSSRPMFIRSAHATSTS